MPLAKALPVISLFLALAASVESRDPKLIAKEIREASAAADHPAVIALCEELRRDHNEVFSWNGFSYVLGKAYENVGDAGRASSNYLQAAENHPLLASYAFWRLSRLQRRSGNLPAERLFLLESLIRDDLSGAAKAANKRLSRSYFESGNLDSAAMSINSGWGTKSPVLWLADDQVLLADILAALGNTQRAVKLYWAVRTDTRNGDDLDLATVEGLARLRSGNSDFTESLADLDPNALFGNGEVYQSNRLFEKARAHYKALYENFPDNSRVPESLFAIGRGYAQRRDHKNAAEWYERLLDEYPENDLAAEALYQAGNAFAAMGETEESSRRFQQFIEENEGSERVPSAYLNLIDLYRDAGLASEAISWADKMLAEFPSGEEAASAHFAKARTHLSQEDWNIALMDLLQLEANGSGSGVSGEALFLKGLVLEKLNRKQDAVSTYLKIPAGFKNFHGWLATKRLREISQSSGSEKLRSTGQSEIETALANFRSASTEEEIKNSLSVLRSAASSKTEYKTREASKSGFGPKREYRRIKFTEREQPENLDLAAEFEFIGAFTEAAIEFQIHEGKTGRTDSEDQRELIADLRKKAGMVTGSVALAEGRWSKIPADYPAEAMPESELRLLFPAPFKSYVLKYSKAERIDPRFVLSIMRQESRFEADVKSIAAARGLMQFIPSTASEIAGELGIDDYSQEDLYDPAFSIRIGSRYLSNLFRLFPDQPAAVAASYNAGEDRMERWLSRANSNDPARYIAEIRFAQTRDYVVKVMNNYRIYQMLYDENLEPLPMSR